MLLPRYWIVPLKICLIDHHVPLPRRGLCRVSFHIDGFVRTFFVRTFFVRTLLSVRRVRTFFVRTFFVRTLLSVRRVRTFFVRTLLFAEISFLWYLSLPAVRSALYTHTILQAFYGGRLKV